MTGTPLINWLRLEDLAARACEMEIRAFAAQHRGERFHACCLRYDGFQGTLGMAYGTREAVEAAVAENRDELGFNYRAYELDPRTWHYDETPRLDPEGYWGAAAPLLAAYRDLMGGDPDEEIAEFFWLRFEYLAECVLRRLMDRDAGRHLRQEQEFLVYCFGAGENVEEVEDRLSRLYPNYNRAGMEFASHPRPGEERPGICDGAECGRSIARPNLRRCTFCGGWFCEVCMFEHGHPELTRRQRFFLQGGEPRTEFRP